MQDNDKKIQDTVSFYNTSYPEARSSDVRPDVIKIREDWPAEDRNVKLDIDGTLRPIDPEKPSHFTTFEREYMTDWPEDPDGR